MAPQVGRVIPSVEHKNRGSGQQRDQLLHLGKGHLCRSRLCAHPLLIQRIAPTARRLGQGHRRRELPSVCYRFLALGQIMHILGTAIGRGDRAGARNPAHIDPHPERLPGIGWGQKSREHLAQPLLVNLPVLHPFIQAWPLTYKQRRQRQFWERAGTIFGQQCIDGVKHRVFGLPETAIDLVTKRLQYGKVHMEHAPLSFSFVGTLPEFQATWCFCRSRWSMLLTGKE